MNKLDMLQEFNSVLADYTPSEKVKELANSTRLVMLAGVTSSGRNTIIKELVRSGKFHYLVSDTTRQPRINNGVEEKDGVEYHFRNEEEVLKRLKLGLYIEAAVVHNQQVSGIGIEELLTASVQHEIGVTDIDNAGANTILDVAPGTIVIFLIPPDFDEWMNRLTKRGKLDQEEIKRRLQSAENELEEAIESENYTIMVNKNYLETARDIQNLAFGLENSQDSKQAKETAWHLVNQLKKAIHS